MIQLKEVGGLTKTTLYGSYEFVIHVPSEYDYRFSSRRYALSAHPAAAKRSSSA